MSKPIDTTKMMVTSQMRYISPWEMRPEDVHIHDIASGLSKTVRYAGQCIGFYSVAQHSVLMAAQVANDTGNLNLARIALLHDAPEAYIGDLIRCVKDGLPDYKDLDFSIWCAVVKAFQLEPLLTELNEGRDFDLPPEVHEADMRMVVTERKWLIFENKMGWNIETKYKPYDWKIESWEWARAYDEFMLCYHQYFPK